MMGRKHWLWLPLVATIAACGVDLPATSSTGSAVTNANGVWQNGLTTNGVWQNGVWQNGVWQNGVWQNGVWQNGVWQNGVWQNGVWQNGVWQNGVWQNGVWQNGVWQNGVWQNGVWQNNLPALELLRDNAYAREVLQYVYSCAMRSDQHATIDYGGDTPLQLDGAIGLAPQWGDAGGECDESCQRWVTACVLARTNAYGARVAISMRAPDNAPAHIREALAVSAEEAARFPLREGGFYGNMFWMSPQSASDARDFVNRPLFYACAGPGSNIPDITRRFMSSQGADEPPAGPIRNTGLCDPSSDPTTVARDTSCSLDATGTVHGCANPEPGQDTKPYDEVITVYIERPLAVCGNNVCEDGESAGEALACESDCRPGTWAEAFHPVIPPSHTWWSQTPLETVSAVAPDHGVILAGKFPSASSITIEGVEYPGTGGVGLDIVLAKYTSDGTLAWVRRQAASDGPIPAAMAVSATGEITLLARAGAGDFVWLGKFDGNGLPLAGWPRRYGGNPLAPQPGGGQLSPDTHLAVDASGRMVIAAPYQGVATFAGLPPITSTNYTEPNVCCTEMDVFVLVLAADGTPVWVKSFGGDGGEAVTELALDPSGNVLFTVRDQDTASANLLRKLRATDGELVWSRPIPFSFASGVGVDAASAVYITGNFGTAFDFGGGPIAPRTSGNELYITKYAADGTFAWTALASYQARPGFVVSGSATGGHVDFDPAGNVIITGVFSSPGGTVDFGAGQLDSSGSGDIFNAAYSPSGQFLWAKHTPMVLQSAAHQIHVDSRPGARSHLVISGYFSGSMTVDGRLLVSDRPELLLRLSNFVASFALPDLSDTDGPIVGHLSQPLVLQATSAQGTQAWYMPPTAIDLGLSGATVYCDPPPHATFAIGTTIVTCTASDPLGNSTTVQFPITVRDALGPIVLGIPLRVEVPATSGSGATVTYTMPRAVDPVCTTGNTISCEPPSGSVFPIGTTLVTCVATDCNGNTTQMTFPVTVTAPTQTPTLEWSGILPPINADCSSVFKLGRVVPVKFALTGTSAGTASLHATLTLTKLSDTVTGTDLEATSVGAADTGNVFRYDAVNDLYVYNLATAGLSVGTWQLSIDFFDGVTRTVTISIRK